MKEKCVLNVFLDNTSKPFYTSSDIVSGYVQAVVLSKIQVTDLDLVLQCEEKASVAINKRDAKKSDQRKVRSAQEKLRHFISVQHPLHTEKGEEPLLLEKGEYTYPFIFHLSDDINAFPPHAPIHDARGLYAGVWWTLEASVHRPKFTQTAYKTSIEVPIQPLPSNGISQMPLEGVRTTAAGFTVVQEKPNFVELLKGQRATGKIFEAQLSYPMAGLPQPPHKPDFRLLLRCEHLTVQIASIEATILQKCKGKARQLEYTYVKEFPVGVSKMSVSLSSGSADVSEHLDHFMLPGLLVAPFASKLVTLTYELRLKVSFVPLLSNAKAKPDTLVIETPVALQSPVLDWAKDQLTNIRPVPRQTATFSDTFSDSGHGSYGIPRSSYGPKSVGDATTMTAATGTGTASSYLSYEIQRPGQVMSNLMDWFGKSSS